MEHPGRVLRAAGALALVLALVGGCGGGSGAALGAVQDAAEQAASALASAELATELRAAGRITDQVADTAQLDALTTLGAADEALATLVPPDTTVGARRDEVAAAVGRATDQVVAARAWVAGASDRTGADVADGFTTVADELDATIAALGAS
ncbi:hypothetical protein [Cellulomonas hominis]